MILQFQSFLGADLRTDPKRLPIESATDALNLRFWSGSLEGYRGLTPDRSLPKYDGSTPIQTVYRYDADPGDPDSGFYLHWPFDVDVVQGMIPDDTQRMIFFSGEDLAHPSVTDATMATSSGDGVYPSASHRLGVPGPQAAPTVELGEEPPPEQDDDGEDIPWEDDDRILRRYAYTYVADWQTREFEGPPSPLSEEADPLPGQAVEVTGLPSAPPSGSWRIDKVRLYRLSGSSYYEVTTLSLGVTSFTDDVATDELGQELLSYDWAPPPEGMFGMDALENGLFFGFYENSVCVSYPYLPHAYGAQNRFPCDYPIVGGGKFGNTIVALTEKNPWLCYGTDPETMVMEEYSINQGCRSKRSIVSGRWGVAYAGQDGLVLINNNGYQLVTAGFLSPDDWRALNPDSIYGVEYEGRYYGFYDDGRGVKRGFYVDPAAPDSGIVFLPFHADCAHSDPLLDRLLLVQGGDLSRWDDGPPAPYRWRSKTVVLARPTALTAVKVIADSYSDLTFRLWADGQLVKEKALTRAVFRCPGNYRAQDFVVEIEGTDRVSRIDLAETAAELGGV